MRRLIAFHCAGKTLSGTVDDATDTTGLLIVSGGNEIRVGAHRGMALLAADIAAAGHPVFRFDRRGIGDSTGENKGFRNSADDITAAVAAFRAEQPQLRRLIAFGNCDAATAIALFHRVAGIDELVLANPWVIEPKSDLPPPAAIRARYARRLKDPKEWLRLLRGGVDIEKLFKGLRSISNKPSEAPSDLVAQMKAALDEPVPPLTLLLARGDNTAVAFADAWQKPAFDEIRERVRTLYCETDSHSFARAEDKVWLREALLSRLKP